jgi:hypothetical protein
MHRSCFANIVPEFYNPVIKGCLKGVIVTVLSIFDTLDFGLPVCNFKYI